MPRKRIQPSEKIIKEIMNIIKSLNNNGNNQKILGQLAELGLRRAVQELLEKESEGFELETEMTLHALHKRFKIVEIPIEYKERLTGSISKLNTIKDGYRVIRRILSIFKDYKPLSFFGFFSILFFTCGLIIGLSVLLDFIETHFVSRVPLAILSTGLMIFSLILLSVGIILKTIIQLHRFDYELKLTNYKD